ncbi:hypothetical protein PC117_g27305 [Phytophthora cactorum]|uniref:Uncharacterized protein n=1 Tax=Phytophthora cactorum TaxID=29920 RepID=A0A8T1AD04_9STRA|nr:hypothetical protein PC117_g27305 [Phytophthora cactorum]
MALCRPAFGGLQLQRQRHRPLKAFVQELASGHAAIAAFDLVEVFASVFFAKVDNSTSILSGASAQLEAKLCFFLSREAAGVRILVLSARCTWWTH